MVSPKIVGELACQQNPYLYELQTKVVSCVEVTSSQADTKRTKKNKENRGTQDASTHAVLWEIECEDSILFPEGGGQPTDHGTLTVYEDPDHPIPVQTIHRRGLRAIIFSPRPLTPGTVITQKVDSRRRNDHMQQHSGQHLLSAIMDTYSGLETLGWSMGASVVGETSVGGLPNLNYIELGRKPTEIEITEIQDKCNQIVMQNRPITVNTSATVDSSSLPADYDKEKGIVRVVTIDGIDENPCCGTHLSQTSHIGPILLHYTQPIRGTNTRLFFTCGERSIAYATSAIRTTRALAATLSTGATFTNLTSRAAQVTTSLRDTLRAKRKLEMEIAETTAAKISQEQVAWFHRAEAGLDFVMEVAGAIPAKNLPPVLLLATGTGAEGGAVLIVGSDAEKVQNLASKAVATVKHLKGGGKGVRWQGKAEIWEKGDLNALQGITNGGDATR